MSVGWSGIVLNLVSDIGSVMWPRLPSNFLPQPPGCWDCSSQVISKRTEGWVPVITTGTPLTPTLANA